MRSALRTDERWLAVWVATGFGGTIERQRRGSDMGAAIWMRKRQAEAGTDLAIQAPSGQVEQVDL